MAIQPTSMDAVFLCIYCVSNSEVQTPPQRTEKRCARFIESFPGWTWKIRDAERVCGCVVSAMGRRTRSNWSYKESKALKKLFFLPLVKGVSISKDSNSVITVITTITTIINHHHHEYQQFDCKAFAGRQVVRSSGRSACLVWWHARHILGRKSPGALRCPEGL